MLWSLTPTIRTKYSSTNLLSTKDFPNTPCLVSTYLFSSLDLLPLNCIPQFFCVCFFFTAQSFRDHPFTGKYIWSSFCRSFFCQEHVHTRIVLNCLFENVVIICTLFLFILPKVIWKSSRLLFYTCLTAHWCHLVLIGRHFLIASNPLGMAELANLVQRLELAVGRLESMSGPGGSSEGSAGGGNSLLLLIYFFFERDVLCNLCF